MGNDYKVTRIAIRPSTDEDISDHRCDPHPMGFTETLPKILQNTEEGK